MAKKQTDEKKDFSDKELEKIGRLVVLTGETGYRNKVTIYKMSFLKGILSGIGGVIGATIAIALLLFFLSLLSEIPLIGEVAKKLETTIENSSR